MSRSISFPRPVFQGPNLTWSGIYSQFYFRVIFSLSDSANEAPTRRSPNKFGDTYAGLARSKVSFRLGPCAKPGLKFTTYVFQRITTYTTSQIRFPHSWSHLHNLELADPNPASRQPIDLLIGANLYWSLLMSDLLQGPLGTPMVPKDSTRLNHIRSSGLASRNADIAQVSHYISDGDTNSLLRRFWKDKKIHQPLPLKKRRQTTWATFYFDSLSYIRWYTFGATVFQDRQSSRSVTHYQWLPHYMLARKADCDFNRRFASSIISFFANIANLSNMMIFFTNTATLTM